METFAKRITKRRKILGLTQKQVSEALGIPLSTYKEWEYGRKIQGESIYVKLSEIFVMDLRTLLTGENYEVANTGNIHDGLRQLDEIRKLLLSLLPADLSTFNG
ncbi:MAG: helix-turn-helix transcriptional regulator [Bdellovibrionaceae bacterium]|nr:helix-turn-helix transcriptional regulator [Pseudobdellovibrionaceae bacterium]